MELLTAAQLAERLDLSIHTIWRWTVERRIPYYHSTRILRYSILEVIDAMHH